jgi:spore germination protein YaaH
MIIDTDNMSIEEMDTIIREMRAIRARKLKAEELKNRMLELIADAKENGFTFIDKDFGQVWTGNDVELYDEQT